MSIRIQNTRPIGATVSYCQASAGMKPCPCRSRKRQFNWARNDLTSGRPTTPMNRK